MAQLPAVSSGSGESVFIDSIRRCQGRLRRFTRDQDSSSINIVVPSGCAWCRRSLGDYWPWSSIPNPVLGTSFVVLHADGAIFTMAMFPPSLLPMDVKLYHASIDNVCRAVPHDRWKR